MCKVHIQPVIMRAIITALLAVAGSILIFLAFTFTNATFDINEWGVTARGFCAAVMLWLVASITLIRHGK